MNTFSTLARRTFLLLLCLMPAACAGGGNGGGGGNPGTTAGSNRARFTFDVDLQGVPGTLVMEVEVINQAGAIWGPGSTPQITAVISAGTFIIFTAGELTSSVANYIFTGENNFADFTEPATSATFRVQWIETAQGMTMVVNPFGPGPVSYACVLTSAVLI